MKKCSVPNCNKPHEAKGYCHTHYCQFKKYGKIRRTQKSKNEIIQYEDYAEIILYNRSSEEVARTQISLESIPLVKDIKWRLLKTKYVEGNKDGKFIRLNRFLLNVTDRKIEVDHIDGNPLNNRLDNLRVCSRSQNAMNTRTRTDNTSGCRGVTLDKRANKWVAYITVDGKTTYLGNYTDKDEAIRVRLKAEQELFGEFQCTH